MVYASEQEIPAAGEKPAEDQIAFLKEQQWTLDFATARAAKRSMRESIVVSGDVRPRSGGEVDVAAPVSGRISPSTRLPVIGAAVAQGQTLASVVPLTPAPGDRPSLELAISEARTALDLARRDLARAERLLAAGAIPARRVDEARAAEATAAARLASAERRLQQFEASRHADGSGGQESAFSVRAPIAGVIAQVSVTPGSNVTQGDRLFRVVAVDQVYVAANVPEAEIPRISRLNGAEVEVTGVAVRIPAGRLVAKSSVVDAQARTLSVLFEVRNPARTLAIGQAVSVRLFLTGSVEAVTVPDSAVIDDGGRPVVFVQKEGEAFVRRSVKPGIREGDLVQIAEGVEAGERVVTKGAYLIRLGRALVADPGPRPRALRRRRMIDALIRWSINNRVLVVVMAAALLAWGGYLVTTMPVDVLPDLTAPTVTILAEAGGMAPTELESFVTFPVEASLNGASGVRRVRSATAVGVAIIWTEFEWGEDIYRARQTVTEKLNLVRGSLPPEVRVALAPISSIMGEILFVTLESERHGLLELRTTADTVIRRRLLAVSGVSQVTPTGGAQKQYQVLVSPAKLKNYDLTVGQVEEALRQGNRNTSAGFRVAGGQEYLIQGIGRVSRTEDIADTVVASRGATPVLVRDVAEVRIGEALKRGEGSHNARSRRCNRHPEAARH